LVRIAAAILLVCLLAVAGAVRPAPAAASHDQLTYFEAPRDLLDPAHREGALDLLASLGVRALRVELYWDGVAPGANDRRRPDFDAANPGAYRWGQYDALVDAAKRRDMKVLLTVSGPVPQWATAGARDHVTRPNAHDFGQFMTAVGRHFGSKVNVWSIWNEPNHPFFLGPQYVHGQPTSPRIYRGLFQAAVDGLHAADVKDRPILMGETAPVGTRHDVAPLVFLRGALCLSPSYQKASSCSALPADGYAHHAYTTVQGPFYRPPADDVTIGVLSRLVRALDAALRAKAVPHRLDIYLTEFGIQSKPNPFLGVSLPKQAEFQEISEHIAWANPRVVAFSQYLLRDDPHISRPGASVRGGSVGFQSGLELANGKPKPSLAGFRLPLAVTRHGGRVSLWGFVRPAHEATTVEVQARDRGSKTWRNILSAHTDADGYWSGRSASHAGRRWRVQWTGRDGKQFTGPPIRAY
jgi:hypothetical protein